MTVVMRTLYKRTTAGKVQQWFLEIDGDKIRASTGQVGGKLNVARQWTVCKPKNVGRSNATTGEEQARLEAESQYRKKLAQGGYSESIEAIDDTPAFFEPMTATKWADRAFVIDGRPEAQPVFSQRKLDGVRCVARADGLWSRYGKPILSVPHVWEALRPLFAEFPDAVLDGELYSHDLADDFNEIIRMVKKQKPTQVHWDKTAQTIQYHVYDWPSIEGGFHNRIIAINDYINDLPASAIRIVQTTQVESNDHLDQLYAEYIEEGYEGQMIRLDEPYEQKRSKSLMKRKEFFDGEYEIVEVLEGQGNRSGMAGKLLYRMEDGRTFKSNLQGGEAYYKELFENREKVVGRTGTVRYPNLTPDGVPRFGVTVTIFDGVRDF